MNIKSIEKFAASHEEWLTPPPCFKRMVAAVLISYLVITALF